MKRWSSATFRVAMCFLVGLFLSSIGTHSAARQEEGYGSWEKIGTSNIFGRVKCDRDSPLYQGKRWWDVQLRSQYAEEVRVDYSIEGEKGTWHFDPEEVFSGRGTYHKNCNERLTVAITKVDRVS